MTVEGATQTAYENGHSATVIDLLHRSILDRIDIRSTREGGFIDCYVPTELIDHEEVPVKEEWAQSLAIEMRQKANENGGTGQKAPINIGYIEGEPKLKIIDGFHRDAALHINGEDTRFSTLEVTNWDKLYDDRIFLAKDHVHVRFSRVVQWIREAWAFSGLSDKLAVEQAVLLYRFDSSGANLHLDPLDVAAAKAWIQRKEELWQMAAMTIHSHLMIAANVDPKLVHSTREKKDSRVLDAPTQAIIKIFSDNLPNDFSLQNLVMDAAMRHNLQGPQVKALCSRVKGKDFAAAKWSIDSINFDDIQSEYGDTTQRALRRAFDPRFKGAVVLKKVTQDTANIRERVEQSVQKKEPVDDEMRQNLREARAAADKVLKDLSGLVTDLTVLIGDKRDAQRNKESTSNDKQPVAPRDERPAFNVPEVKIPAQQDKQSAAFQTIIRAFLGGNANVLPPMENLERIQMAEDLLDWQREFGGRSGTTPRRIEVLEQRIEEARARLSRRR